MNQYITYGLWVVACGSAGCGLRDCDSADSVGNWSPKWEGGDGCSEADRRWRLASAGCSPLGDQNSQRRPAWLWLSETTTRLRLCASADGECGVLGWRLRTVRRRGVRMAAAVLRTMRVCVGKLGDLGN
nr:hypothetical protein Itr_chr07CG08370 [Ipomoea trifida]GLL49468.1 hypothetical protein Itr_chr15CG10310 [Ipomoea trifida]GMC95311.1 hypothetical protein Iba_chr05cCG7330 [Ipomoea batatas]